MKSLPLEIAAKAEIHSVQTSASGASYVQLGNYTCNQAIIHNKTGTVLRVAYCDLAGADRPGETYLTIADGVALAFRGISNANQLKLKRDDESNSQVTVRFVIEGVATV